MCVLTISRYLERVNTSVTFAFITQVLHQYMSFQEPSSFTSISICTFTWKLIGVLICFFYFGSLILEDGASWKICGLCLELSSVLLSYQDRKTANCADKLSSFPY